MGVGVYGANLEVEVSADTDKPALLLWNENEYPMLNTENDILKNL